MSSLDAPAAKTHLRTALLRVRDGLPPSEREAKSKLLQDRVLSLPEFAGASCVCVYLSVRSEADTEALVQAALAGGKRVLVPVVDRAAKRLLLSELQDPQEELAPGPFGIPEPLPQYRRFRSPEAVDLMILPCVGFDEQGYRLGYGHGYYDRLLARLRRTPPPSRIVVAFEAQRVEHLPVEAHDIPVDRVVTEERVRDFRRGESEN